MAESQKTERDFGGPVRDEKPLISLNFWSLLWEFRAAYTKGIITLIVVDAANVAIPLFLKTAIDAISLSQREKVYQGALAILGLFLLQSVGRYLWRIYLIGSSHKIASLYRKRLFDHVLKVPCQSYRSMSVGDLLSRTTQDVESIRRPRPSAATVPWLTILAPLIVSTGPDAKL